MNSQIKPLTKSRNCFKPVDCQKKKKSLLSGKSIEEGGRPFRDREDHSLPERKRWLWHLLFPLRIVGLLTDVVVHFCENGDKVDPPGKTLDTRFSLNNVKVLKINNSLSQS